jgi:hypothetical protein
MLGLADRHNISEAAGTDARCDRKVEPRSVGRRSARSPSVLGDTRIGRPSVEHWRIWPQLRQEQCVADLRNILRTG